MSQKFRFLVSNFDPIYYRKSGFSNFTSNLLKYPRSSYAPVYTSPGYPSSTVQCNQKISSSELESSVSNHTVYTNE